jgi:hypothetical protein
MEGSGDDTRKKRDCPHVDDGEETADGSSPGEKCKKFRQEETLDGRKESTAPTESSKHEAPNQTVNKSSPDQDCNTCTTTDSSMEPVDVETAMHCLFQQEDMKESLSSQMSVEFRAGHGGDAPAIESCYHDGKKAAACPTPKQQTNEKTGSDDKQPRERKNSESSPSLELWLSEAMGDEDTPPSVFCIVANVSPTALNDDDANKTAKRLGAVALFTVAWKDKQRMLRLEWLHVDTSLPEAQVLKHRMWLRLSTLALMTGACLSVPNDFVAS